jgi:alkanesulfonate monooxygenase SsuD/methylene tetrahydromethanopterin reductase-like flavin-dependent oxidoreductase (luciferase family)
MHLRISSATALTWTRRWNCIAGIIAPANCIPSRNARSEALYQFKSRERALIERESGIRQPLISPEEAAARALTPDEQAFSKKLLRHAVVGTAEQVKARLTELATRLDLDELVVVTWTYDAAPRRRSYELLAQAFELTKA